MTADQWCILVGRIGIEFPSSVMGPYKSRDAAFKASRTIDHHKWWHQITRMDENAPF